MSSTASANTRKPTAAAKTLFTPKNTVPRVAKRESLSAVKEKTVKPSEEGSQFKLPSKTTDAHLKKTVAPTRTGRLQPTKLSLPNVRPVAGHSCNNNSSKILNILNKFFAPPYTDMIKSLGTVLVTI